MFGYEGTESDRGYRPRLRFKVSLFSRTSYFRVFSGWTAYISLMSAASDHHRLGVREALRMTIDAFKISAQELSLRARVSSGTLSGYRNGRREINTSSLQRILNELEPSAFLYWLDLMRESEQLLLDQSESTHPDIPADTAFLGLVETYTRNCSTEQQLALLRVIYLASDANPNLRSE